MKKILHILLPICILSGQLAEADECMDWLELANEEMNAMYYTGDCCEDQVFNGVATSMFAWGVGLFVGIAVVTGFVYNSKSSKTKAGIRTTSTTDIN